MTNETTSPMGDNSTQVDTQSPMGDTSTAVDTVTILPEVSVTIRYLEQVAAAHAKLNALRPTLEALTKHVGTELAPTALSVVMDHGVDPEDFNKTTGGQTCRTTSSTSDRCCWRRRARTPPTGSPVAAEMRAAWQEAAKAFGRASVMLPFAT